MSTMDEFAFECQRIYALAMSDVSQCDRAIDELASRTLHAPEAAERRVYDRELLNLRLFVARRANLPLSRCDELFRQRNELGFNTLADKLIHMGAQARYCRTMGDGENASRIATAALAELEAAEDRGSDSFEEIEAALHAILR